MFLRVPVAYHAEFVRKGHQRKENPLLGEWVDVHVVELADPEAPVATRRASGRIGAEGDETVETRWFDGSHWAPVDYTAAGRPPEHVDAGRLADACAEGNGYANPLISGPDWQARRVARGEVGPLADIAVRQVISSGRDAAIAQAQANAEDVVIVDGLAWRRVPEPVYLVKQDTMGFEPYVSLEVTDVDNLSHKGAAGVFAANRWDDAVEYARSLRADRTRVPESSRIDVFVPESIRFDDERPALLSAMKTILEWGPPEMKEATREQAVAWIDFRDAFRLARVDPTDINLDALVDAAEANASANFEGDGWRAGRLEAAVDRWRVRPLAIGQDVAPLRLR